MAELYSIVGLFHESFPGISPWGGHFVRGREGSDRREIEGMLIDMYGPSGIRGSMDEERLTFFKQYGPENGSACFTYEFKLNDKGIWVGGFEQENDRLNAGRSACKTDLFMGNLEFRNVDLNTFEGYASALVDSMVTNGQLEEFVDKATGQKMLRPRR